MANNKFTRNLTTRAGKGPDETKLPYSFTTPEVEKYIQDKLDTVVERYNAKVKKIEQESGRSIRPLQPVKANLYTIDCTSIFKPFMVMLPLSVLASGKPKGGDSFFENFAEDGEGPVKMKGEFYEIFSPYIYNKDDEKAFISSPSLKHSLGISGSGIGTNLKSLRVPRQQSFNGGKLQCVAFILDPCRVFHDMLMIDGEDRNAPINNFSVAIPETTIIERGKAVYSLLRKTSGKNTGAKYGNSIADELERRVRGNVKGGQRRR